MCPCCSSSLLDGFVIYLSFVLFSLVNECGSSYLIICHIFGFFGFLLDPCRESTFKWWAWGSASTQRICWSVCVVWWWKAVCWPWMQFSLIFKAFSLPFSLISFSFLSLLVVNYYYSLLHRWTSKSLHIIRFSLLCYSLFLSIQASFQDIFRCLFQLLRAEVGIHFHSPPNTLTPKPAIDLCVCVCFMEPN